MTITLANITPDRQGFAALQTQSMAAGFNMLRRLEENWRSGQNRFDKPGEKLLGAFAGDLLIGVCGINQDPYLPGVRAGRLRHLYVDAQWRRMQVGMALLNAMLEGADRWFDFINTNAPPAAFTFYARAGFIPLTDTENVTHRLSLKGTER